MPWVEIRKGGAGGQALGLKVQGTIFAPTNPVTSDKD